MQPSAHAYLLAKATPTVAWPVTASIPYGTALGTATLNGAAVTDIFIYTPAGTVRGVGTHTLSAQFTPTDTTDFVTPAAVTVSIAVTQPELTVTADSATRVHSAQSHLSHRR